jgi:hypothetical protein
MDEFILSLLFLGTPTFLMLWALEPLRLVTGMLSFSIIEYEHMLFSCLFLFLVIFLLLLQVSLYFDLRTTMLYFLGVILVRRQLHPLTHFLCGLR